MKRHHTNAPTPAALEPQLTGLEHHLGGVGRVRHGVVRESELAAQLGARHVRLRHSRRRRDVEETVL